MGLLSFPAENPRREENLQGKLHIAYNERELKQHLQQETVILPTRGGRVMKSYSSIPLLISASANPRDQPFCLSSWSSLVSGPLVGHPQRPI